MQPDRPLRHLFSLALAFAVSGCASLSSLIVDGRTDEAVKRIQEGASLDERDDQGRGPLHHAVIVGDAEVFQALLERGAALDATDFNGDTPLHLAVREGREPMAVALIDAGAELLGCNRDGESAVSLAARSGSAAISEPMIRAGARFSKSCPKADMSPIEIAIRENQDEIVDQLILSGQLNPSDRRKKYIRERMVHLLHFGSAHETLREPIRKHLKRYASILSAQGTSPLVSAIRARRPDQVDFLLSLGTDPNAGRGNAPRAIQAAVRAQDYDLAVALNESGARLTDLRQDELDRALLRSTASKDAQAVKRLIQLGAHPATEDESGRDPLSLAVSQLDHPTIELLLDAGMDLSFGQAARLAEDVVDQERSVGKREKTALEEATWSLCLKRRSSRSCYEYFSRTYPESSYREQAEEALTYANVEKSAKAADYRNYLSNYPRGLFRKEARFQLNALTSPPGRATRADLNVVSRFLVKIGSDVLLARGFGAASRLFASIDHRVVIDFGFKESRVINKRLRGVPTTSNTVRRAVARLHKKALEFEGLRLVVRGVFHDNYLTTHLISAPPPGAEPGTYYAIKGATLVIGAGSLIFDGSVQVGETVYRFERGRLMVTRPDLSGPQYAEGTTVLVSRDPGEGSTSRYAYRQGSWVRRTIEPLVFKN